MFDQHLHWFLGLAHYGLFGLRKVFSSLIPESGLLRFLDSLLTVWAGLTCV